MNKIPHEKGWPIFGHALTALRGPLPFLSSLNQPYPELVKIMLLGKTYYVIQSPEICQHILQKNFKNYYKPGEAKELKRFLGEGLATSNGDLWLRQRRLIQPIFHRRKIESFIEIIDRETQELSQEWKSTPLPHIENINQRFLKLTLSNIVKAMFGTDLKKDLGEVSEIVHQLLTYGTQRATSILKIPHYIPTPANLTFQKLNRQFEQLIFGIIEQRKQTLQQKKTRENNDLLDMLLQAYDDETQYYMTDQQLKDEIVTIFMAGHETTAQTLSWVFYLLAAHPSICHKVKAEVDAIGNEKISLADFDQLKYTQSVIEETLRLYPPVWVIARKAYEKDQVSATYSLPKGATVLLNVYGMHHNPAYWHAPNTFNPEEFLVAKEKLENSFAYIPFGGGPRICIGNRFAMMVMLVVVCRLIQKFDFEVPDGQQPVVIPGFTLRAKEDISLLVNMREGNSSS